jgi:hypothetical protein
MTTSTAVASFAVAPMFAIRTPVLVQTAVPEIVRPFDSDLGQPQRGVIDR